MPFGFSPAEFPAAPPKEPTKKEMQAQVLKELRGALQAVEAEVTVEEFVEEMPWDSSYLNMQAAPEKVTVEMSEADRILLEGDEVPQPPSDEMEVLWEDETAIYVPKYIERPVFVKRAQSEAAPMPAATAQGLPPMPAGVQYWEPGMPLPPVAGQASAITNGAPHSQLPPIPAPQAQSHPPNLPAGTTYWEPGMPLPPKPAGM